MRIGDYIRNRETGRILKYVRESSDRAGTKERTVYVCEVVFPGEEVGKIERVCVYDVAGPEWYVTYEELTPLEILAYAAVGE